MSSASTSAFDSAPAATANSPAFAGAAAFAWCTDAGAGKLEASVGSATSCVCPLVLATAGPDLPPLPPAGAPLLPVEPLAPVTLAPPWPEPPPAGSPPEAGFDALADAPPWPREELEPQPASGTAAAAQHRAAIEKRSIFIVLQG